MWYKNNKGYYIHNSLIKDGSYSKWTLSDLFFFCLCLIPNL